jgi:hypothetical protein
VTLPLLQTQLQANVLHGAGDIVAGIDTSEAVPAATRLEVYANAYRLRLIEALQSNYPVLHYLLGDEQFSELALGYLAEHPSQHFSIRWFGHRLAEYVGIAPQYAERSWLHELAQWEWATAAAFDAADATVLTMDMLAQVAPQDWLELRFALHPSLTRLQVASNVVALVKAAAAEQSPPAPQELPAANWCIWRQDLQVRYRSLATEEAAALAALANGANFGGVCEELTAFWPVEQVPMQAASLLKTWLNDHWLAAAD